MFSWLLSMVALWSWSAGYNIVEQGDDITRCLNKKTLIIVNHQSTADVPLLMSAFNAKPCVLPHIMWIMDKAFKYTNFGIVSMFHLDFFIASVRHCFSHLILSCSILITKFSSLISGQIEPRTIDSAVRVALAYGIRRAGQAVDGALSRGWVFEEATRGQSTFCEKE